MNHIPRSAFGVNGAGPKILVHLCDFVTYIGEESMILQLCHLSEGGLVIFGQLDTTDEIVEVSGFAHSGFWAPRHRWRRKINEDEATAVVRFSGGAWLKLTASSTDAVQKPCSVTVTGTKGVYAFDQRSWTMSTVSGRTRNRRIDIVIRPNLEPG